MQGVPTLSPGGAVGLMGRSGGAPGMQSLTRSTVSATSTEAATVQESMWKAGIPMPARPQQDLHRPLAPMVGAQVLLPILLLEIWIGMITTVLLLFPIPCYYTFILGCALHNIPWSSQLGSSIDVLIDIHVFTVLGMWNLVMQLTINK